MVKFGRHLQFYLESDELQQSDGGNDEPYIVPYPEIRECIGQSQREFVREWTLSLKNASDDYNQRIRRLWKRIFDDLFTSSTTSRRRRQNNANRGDGHHLTNPMDRGIPESGSWTSFCEEHRGLQNDKAIQLYVETMEESQSRELFAYIKKLHSTAAMNCEALRKLVKKFDKGASARGDDLLTSSLFPELYSAPFMGYPCLEGYIEILRETLVVSEDEGETEEDSDIIAQNNILSYQKDSILVKRRAEELSWLHSMLASIPQSELSSLVAHRGFHCPRDGSDKRPLENSLAAFESAWCGGINLCECDVALTKDEKLVLAHDDDFSRLALDPNSSCSKKKVGDLTMKEIISLTFKSGSRPPLLVDVLRSAKAIGEESKLVIEIKPGNKEACTALVRLFRHHPELIDRCAAVMSFDAWVMHKLRREIDDLASSFRDPGSFIPTNMQMPELLLLTVAKEPQQLYELWVDISDLSPVHSWLSNDKTTLDGVYLQFQPEMLEPSGTAALRALSRSYSVGIWGEFGRDPDNYSTATHLIRDCGVSFVNTDLPRSFKGNYARNLGLH